jgi:hypothetical protein
MLNPVAASAQKIGENDPGEDDVEYVVPQDVTPGDVSNGDTSRGNFIDGYFPDDNLADAVKRAFTPDVTAGDVVTPAQLANIDSITVDAVTDWTGMDKLTNLYSIIVTPTVEYDIQELAPLASYTQVKSIALGVVNPWDTGYSENQNIKGDISVFSNMTQLKSIFGFATRLNGSLDDLQNLSNLEHIHFNGDQITGTTSMLTGFNDLGLLSLHNTSVTGTLSDIATLEDLYQLEVVGPGIEGNIEVFSDFTGMKAFAMEENEGLTGDTSDLPYMPDLLIVSIRNTNISSSIGDFTNCSLLENFYLYGNVTGSLSELGEKVHLTSLGVDPTVYSTPEDINLFPNLSDYDPGMFTAPILDTEGSTLTYNKDQDLTGVHLRPSNKLLGLVKDVLVDGTKLSVATEDTEGDYYLEWDDENYTSGCIVLRPNFLNTLESGSHIFTLVIPQGGSLSGTFTIGSSIVASHTVTFVDWKGTVIDTVTVTDGAAATAPAAPSRVGYTFTGWDKAFNNVTADLTVTAQYSINQYTVTFRDWDGTVLDAQRITHGAAATVPTSPSRAGYGFVGWDVAFNNVTSDLVVTAVYQANVFTVTFVDFDGKVLDKQTVAFGKPAEAPADPTRQGYEFTGWDKGFASVTADMTVTAKYHVLSSSSYEINKPGTVDGTTLEGLGDIIIKAEGVTLIGGSLEGNVRVEAAKAVLKNLTIAGSVYLTAKDTTMTDSKIEGSLTASAESISLRNLTIGGNLSIGATNISLVGGTVGGNLTIERTVGNGHVEISGVTAQDTIMYVKGGGSNSIIVNDSKFGAIVVEKILGAGLQAVRVAVQGKTEVANMIVNSSAVIEDTTEEGKGIQLVTLSKEIPASSTVELRGAIKEVTVQKEALTVVNNAKVEKLQVEASALTLVNNATVSELKVEANVKDTKVEGDKINNIVLAKGAEEPVYVPRPQSNYNSGDDNDMDGNPQVFLPKGADGKANLYGKVSVYEDALLAGGAKAKARLLPLTEALKAAANEFAKTQDTPNTPFAYVDVIVDGYKSGKVTIKFNLYDISENDAILVFHQKKDGTWESIIPDKIEDGAVTVTFTSLSPVVFSEVTAGAAGSAKVSSPNTGDSGLNAIAVVCILGICAGLGCLQLNRRKYRR